MNSERVGIPSESYRPRPLGPTEEAAQPPGDRPSLGVPAPSLLMDNDGAGSSRGSTAQCQRKAIPVCQELALHNVGGNQFAEWETVEPD